MSVMSRERFLTKELSIELTRASAFFEPFDYSYTCTEKEKKYKKRVSIMFLGQSPRTDLLPEKVKDAVQYICCDEDGNLYEVCVITRGNKPILWGIRTDRVNKEKKVKAGPEEKGETNDLSEQQAIDSDGTFSE